MIRALIAVVLSLMLIGYGLWLELESRIAESATHEGNAKTATDAANKSRDVVVELRAEAERTGDLLAKQRTDSAARARALMRARSRITELEETDNDAKIWAQALMPISIFNELRGLPAAGSDNRDGDRTTPPARASPANP